MVDTKTKSTAAKPIVAAKKATAAKKAPVAAKKPAAKTAKAAKSTGPKLSSQEHYNMVQVAAYYIAERNNFVGDPLQFWTVAEAEVQAMLSKRR